MNRDLKTGIEIAGAIYLAIQTIVRLTPTKNDDKKFAELQGKGTKVWHFIKMLLTLTRRK